MKKLIVILLLIAGSVTTHAQSLQLLSKHKEGAVHLRWVPTDAATWQLGNQYGYTLTRRTIQKGEKQYKKGTDEVTTQIKPYTKEQWYALTEQVDYAKLITGYFYEDPITTTDTAIVNNAWRGRFAFCMLVADFSPEVATGLALRFKDETTKEDEKYTYKVVLNKPVKTPEISVQTLADFEVAYPDFPPNDLKDIDFVDHLTILKWTLPTRAIYSAYYIERSDDGGITYNRINKTPFLPVGNDEVMDFATYSDSVGTLQKNYYYRIRGIDPFSDLSSPSNSVKVYAYETNLIGGQNVDYSFPNQKSVTIRWEYPDSLKINIKGFDVYKTNGSQDPVKVNTKLLESPIYAYTDRLNPLDEILYYFVDAVDLRGKSYRSSPASVSIIDSIPPIPVRHLGGEITKEGVVTLCWSPNPELDMYGYDVYRAEGYSKNDMYLAKRLTNKNATTVMDTVDMGMRNPKLHYVFVAVDNHTNYSDNSDTLTLVRPDVFPPEPPSFTDVVATDSSVVISWVPSNSFDVIKYTLYRQYPPETSKDSLLSFGNEDWVASFEDKNYEEAKPYIYILEAFDTAGYSSGDACQRKITVPKPLRRSPVEQLKTAYNKKEKEVTLNWEYSCRIPVKSYVVFRRTEKDNSFSKIKECLPNETEFIDTSIPEKTTVFYRVYAYLEDGTRSLEGKATEINIK